MRLALIACLTAGCEDAPSVDFARPGGSGSVVAKIDCTHVAAKVRATYTQQQVDMFKSDATLAKWFDTTIRIIRESCDQDSWPEPVKQCIVAAKSGSNTLQSCNQTMPAALQQKLQKRMVAAMNRAVP